MEIGPSPSLPSLQVPLKSAPELVNAWRVGQLVSATVARVDAARQAVVLVLAEGELEARSALPLQPGMRLQLTPEMQDGIWLLRLRHDPAATETMAAALRRTLPREAPLAPLFQKVEQILQQAPKSLPPALLAQAEALMRSQPTPERLSRADTLRQVLHNAGLFLEAQLADAETPPPTDLKARLLALWLALGVPSRAANAVAPRAPAVADTPDEAPSDPARARNQPTRKGEAPQPLADLDSDALPTLLRQVEGALARIQLHQLRALPDAQEPQWIFELPVRTPQGTETLTLRFEREQEREATGNGGETGWRVTVDLSHADYGALRAVIAWHGGKLATRFFAERSATAELFRRHLPQLGERLTAAGIPIAAMEAHAGIPAAAPSPSFTGLLSERA